MFYADNHYTRLTNVNSVLHASKKDSNSNHFLKFPLHFVYE